MQFDLLLNENFCRKMMYLKASLDFCFLLSSFHPHKPRVVPALGTGYGGKDSPCRRLLS